jgi:hypothetical protein
LAGLIGVRRAVILARREEARRRQLVAVSEVTRDWEPTWKINAVTDAWVMENEKDDIPSNFVLRIEENRMVRDIGGGEVMEIRWRPPTMRSYYEAPAHTYLRRPCLHHDTTGSAGHQRPRGPHRGTVRQPCGEPIPAGGDTDNHDALGRGPDRLYRGG